MCWLVDLVLVFDYRVYLLWYLLGMGCYFLVTFRCLVIYLVWWFTAGLFALCICFVICFPVCVFRFGFVCSCATFLSPFVFRLVDFGY